jgi:hypothetical protein
MKAAKCNSSMLQFSLGPLCGVVSVFKCSKFRVWYFRTLAVYVTVPERRVVIIFVHEKLIDIESELKLHCLYLKGENFNWIIVY